MNFRTCLPFLLSLTLGCSANVPLDGTGASARAENAVDLGRMAPGTEVDFVVGLSLRRRSLLRARLFGHVTGDANLAPDDFAAEFAPTALEYANVLRWLRAHGVLVTRTTPGRTTVSAHATAAAVEQLLGVELHDYSDAGGRFFAAAGPLNVTPELVGVVEGVVGL